MDIKERLLQNPHVRSLPDNEQEVLVSILTYVDAHDRDDAMELLNQQPSLIPILISNYTQKKDIAATQGRDAAQRFAKAHDADIIAQRT